jgi:acyl-CoA dehydrogenase
MTNFALPEEIEQLRQSAARFAADVLSPAARRSEAASAWPAELVAVLDGFALGGLDLPARLHGVDAGSVAKVVLLETLAQGDAGGLPGADQPGPTVGALLGCPDAKLVASVADAAARGQGGAALCVIADDEPSENARVHWAPARPGLRFAWLSRGDTLQLFDVRDLLEPSPALAFQASGGVSAPLLEERLLGSWSLPAGAGVQLRGRARLWGAAVAVGVAQAAFDATVEYTRERVVFGKPVAHHQGNAFELAVAATELHGARLIVREAARAFDAAEAHAGFWATQAWLSALAAAAQITDLGVQLLGGHGFLLDHLAEKRFREARMLALLHGGRDAAEADLAAMVLDVPHPAFGGAGTQEAP